MRMTLGREAAAGEIMIELSKLIPVKINLSEESIGEEEEKSLFGLPRIPTISYAGFRR